MKGEVTHRTHGTLRKNGQTGVKGWRGGGRGGGGGLHDQAVAHKNSHKLWSSAQELQEVSQNSSIKRERLMGPHP